MRFNFSPTLLKSKNLETAAIYQGKLILILFSKVKVLFMRETLFYVSNAKFSDFGNGMDGTDHKLIHD